MNTAARLEELSRQRGTGGFIAVACRDGAVSFNAAVCDSPIWRVPIRDEPMDRWSVSTRTKPGIGWAKARQFAPWPHHHPRCRLGWWARALGALAHLAIIITG